MKDGEILVLYFFFFGNDHGDWNTNGKFILVTLSKTITHVHKSNMQMNTYSKLVVHSISIYTAEVWYYDNMYICHPVLDICSRSCMTPIHICAKGTCMIISECRISMWFQCLFDNGWGNPRSELCILFQWIYVTLYYVFITRGYENLDSYVFSSFEKYNRNR